jgi:dolichol-phosphate mannosyltransferase
LIEQSSQPAEQLQHSSGNPPEVSVILPTFNEKDNIVPLVEELRSRFLDKKYSYEILVIDDCSPDGTAEIVAATFEGDPRIRLIVRERQRGLAYSIRHGIEQSTGMVIVAMDTDFNHRPGDAVLLFEVARHVDLAIGSRFTFGGGMANLTRYYLSYLYNIFLRLSLGTRMDENLSGFFAIKRERLFALDFDKIFWGYGDYFFRLLLLSQRKRFLHVELPIFYEERHSGASKTRFRKVFVQYTCAVFYLIYQRALRRW